MKNKRTWVVTIVLSLLLIVSQVAFALQFTAEKTVFKNNKGSIKPVLNLSKEYSGDLYLAYRSNGSEQLYFINTDGLITKQTSPYSHLKSVSGLYPLPSFDTASILKGRYQMYLLIVKSGGDFADFQQWLTPISSINFSILDDERDLDINNDGWFEDDLNKDGFHDTDTNKDGYYDDDKDKDGIRDVLIGIKPNY